MLSVDQLARAALTNEKGTALATTMAHTPVAGTVGVDTHKNVHVGAVLDDHGAVLGTRAFGATVDSYQALQGWAATFGTITAAGVEGTSSWGAGLSRHLRAQGIAVVEVHHTNRQHRRRNGKSDTADVAGRSTSSTGR